MIKSFIIHNKNSIMKEERNLTQHLVFIALGTVLILLVPLIAMQFTREVNWSLNDFITAGILLFSTGLIYELLSRKFNKHKLLVGIVVLLGFLYLWAELAVGIFTNWGS